MTNAISNAFQAAGYMPVRERLMQTLLAVCALPECEWAQAKPSNDTNQTDNKRLKAMALEAKKVSPHNWDGAKDAFYQRVRGDAALLWEMFAPYRAQAVQRLFTEASSELRELERAREIKAVPSAGGQTQDDNQICCAPRAKLQSSGGRGHHSDDDLERPAPSARSTAAMDAVLADVRLSLLDTFIVNGQSIGDLTSEEAIKWAGSRERDARFVRMLTANLPQDQPIRKYRSDPDEVQAIYDMAGQAS